MRKRPILTCVITLVVLSWIVSLTYSYFNYSKTVLEGLFTVCLEPLFYCTVWFILKKFIKNKTVIRVLGIIFLIICLLNVIFYMEDYIF